MYIYYLLINFQKIVLNKVIFKVLQTILKMGMSIKVTLLMAQRSHWKKVWSAMCCRPGFSIFSILCRWYPWYSTSSCPCFTQGGTSLKSLTVQGIHYYYYSFCNNNNIPCNMIPPLCIRPSWTTQWTRPGFLW